MKRYTPFLLVLIFGALLAATRVLDPVDLKVLDVEFRLLRAWFPKPAPREVAVVGIDESTTKAFSEPIALWHQHLARFLSAMVLAKPGAVAVDIALPDRSFESVLPGLERDLMKGLVEARRAYPLVLALTLDAGNRPRAIHRPFAMAAGEDAIGLALLPVDPDGVVRRFDEHLGVAGERVDTLVGRMARRLHVEPHAGFLDYREGARFEYLPLQRVLQWADEGDEAALVQAFQGKPVMLGMVLPFEDRLPSPVPLAAWEANPSDTPGMLIQAQALRNLLNGGLVQPAPGVVITSLTVLGALFWFLSASTPVIVTTMAVLGAMLFALSTWLIAQGWFVPMMAPMLTAMAALGGRHGYDTFLKLRERRRLRASFSGYVSPAIMDEILAGRIKPELGGARRFICIMFSDIRSYTTRTERMAPEEVIDFLNRYFERVVGVVHDHGGSVVCFMGDGIMAVFGAPKPLADPCREALAAAREMLAFVAELNEEFRARNVERMDIGIGLNAGDAVVGHVGSSTRHDYTAIGDVSNVASRVEGLTKEAGYRIVVTRTVADLLGESAGLVPLGEMAIKGHDPVEVYGFEKVDTAAGDGTSEEAQPTPIA